MRKTAAVLVSEEPEEALRMALGLMLLDDHVDVFFLDRLPAESDGVRESVALLGEMGAGMLTNLKSAPFEVKSDQEIALLLGAYDLVVS